MLMSARGPLSTAIPALLVLCAVALPHAADAQLINRIKKTVKNAAEGETLNRIDQLVRGKVRCVFDDLTCIRGAKDNGKEVVLTDDAGKILVGKDGNPVSDPADGAKLAQGDATAAPGTGVWANYDFIPGETVLFHEDYSADKVGDFPRRLELVRGNWEVVEWEGRRLLRNPGPRGSAIRVALPRALPERFTIEIEVYLEHTNEQLMLTTAAPASGSPWRTVKGNVLRIGSAQGTGVDHPDRAGVRSVNPTRQLSETLKAVRIMVDGRYAKVYVDEQRVANVPNAEFPRGSELYIENIYSASPQTPVYVGAIRVAEGGRDLYDRLAADGRVATQGILFAVNSARLRPESTPTLAEIGQMLKDHPDLRLRIEGHTDATGDDAFNQRLSEERAAAAREYLVKTFGIESSRLQASGFGESKPVDSNDTPEGRQNNRRVELVKLDP
jgi:outer membrane protein OmpA-like peptidoglycan-associated protein